MLKKFIVTVPINFEFIANDVLLASAQQTKKEIVNFMQKNILKNKSVTVAPDDITMSNPVKIPDSTKITFVKK